jgi:hypothetical protein
VIKLDHLRAAIAVWEYCDASAKLIFGDVIGDVVADTILAALRNARPAGLSRMDITNLFHRHQSAQRLDLALATLLRLGKIRQVVPPPGRGKTPEMWVAT